MNGLKPGTIIDGRFRLMDEIGRGGMGVVYRAMHLDINKQVAVKILRHDGIDDPIRMKRFRREAHVISLLKHPNIVHIFSIGLVQPEQPYIAMEFLPGEQMSQQIERRGAIPWKEAVPLFVQICHALQHAHELQIIHRDVKPSNIVVGQDESGNPSAKLVDFGIAKFLADRSAKLTQAGEVIGTVSYSSPEQFEGKQADVCSEIYSLGCTMYQALTGKLPCLGETVFETVNSHINTEPEPINQANPSADVPSDLNYLVQRMLRKDRAERPQSAREISDQLSQILANRKIQRSELSSSRPRKSNTRTVLQVSTFAIILLGIIGAVAVTTGMLIKLKDNPTPVAEVNVTGNKSEQTTILRIKSAVKGSKGYLQNVCDLAGFYDPSKNDFPKSGLSERMNQFDLMSQMLNEHAYDVVEKPDESILWADIAQDLADSYERTGQVQKAINLELGALKRAIVQSNIVQTNHIFQVRLHLLRLYNRVGDYQAASDLIPQLMPAVEYGRKSESEVNEVYSTAIVVQTALGKKEAAAQLESAFDAAAPGHPAVNCTVAEAYALLKAGHPELASKRYRRVAEILLKPKSENYTDTLKKKQLLVRILTEWKSVAGKGELKEVTDRLAVAKKDCNQLFEKVNDRSALKLPI